jgi:hypothetical protein
MLSAPTAMVPSAEIALRETIKVDPAGTDGLTEAFVNDDTRRMLIA